MKNIVLSVVVMSVLMVSCKKEEEIPVSNKPIIPFTQLGNKAVQPSATPQTSTQSAPAQQVANGGVVAPGMNPAHGQPGHRCEIAVGAPLNSAKPSAPVSAPTQVVSQPKVVSAPVPVAAPTGPVAPTPEGMNPPHGQDGHVCSVAVGAPLPK
jgi:hypothetical protein